MRTIGLVLSGGGTLGVAHLGVLEELTKHQIPVHRVCGTSAGAIIGLLYASGGVPTLHMFLDDLERAGIIESVRGILLRPMEQIFREIEQIIRKHVRTTDFRELSIPFSCIASDLVCGRMCILEEGDPVAAVMASAASPGVFPIQRIDGRLLVDGAVTRNFPADVLRKRDDLDFIIGSSIYLLPHMTRKESNGKMSRLRAIVRSIEVLVQESNNQQIANCDFCFIPPVEVYKQFDVGHVRDICNLGRLYAAEEIENLCVLLRERGWNSADIAPR